MSVCAVAMVHVQLSAFLARNLRIIQSATDVRAYAEYYIWPRGVGAYVSSALIILDLEASIFFGQADAVDCADE